MGDYEALAATAEKVVRENYSYLCIRQPEVDKALASLAEGAANVSTNMEFHELLNSSLRVIPDPHLRIISSDGRGRSAFTRPQKTNYSREAILSNISTAEVFGPLVLGDIGNIFYVGTELLLPEFTTLYKNFSRCVPDHDSFIVDFRGNTGGSDVVMDDIVSELLGDSARAVAHYFRKRLSKKDPSKLGDLKPVYIEPSSSRRRNVAVLVGPQTCSSAESTAMKFAAIPDALVIGDVTYGSSGCPQRYLLDGSSAGERSPTWEMNGATFALDIPSWLNYRPDKVLLEGNGIIPDIVIPTDQTFVNGNDKVLERAIELLTT